MRRDGHPAEWWKDFSGRAGGTGLVVDCAVYPSDLGARRTRRFIVVHSVSRGRKLRSTNCWWSIYKYDLSSAKHTISSLCVHITRLCTACYFRKSVRSPLCSEVDQNISHNAALFVQLQILIKLGGFFAASCGVCVSVRLSVTFVHFVNTSKYIFKIFSPSGSHTILVFFHTKRHGNIPTGTLT